jgi:hypothetical protein
LELVGVRGRANLAAPPLLLPLSCAQQVTIASVKLFRTSLLLTVAWLGPPTVSSTAAPAMAIGVPALLPNRLHILAHLARVVVRRPMVVVPSPETSPAVRNRQSTACSAPARLAGGAMLTAGVCSSVPVLGFGCTGPGACSISAVGFFKRFQKCFSRKSKNDSKNRILRSIAPNWMKQVLLRFL